MGLNKGERGRMPKNGFSCSFGGYAPNTDLIFVAAIMRLGYFEIAGFSPS